MSKLWVDDIRRAPEGWTHAKTITEAIRLLHSQVWEEISLDFDISMKVSIGYGDPRPFASAETFEPVARFIAAYMPRHVAITLHTANKSGAEMLRDILGAFDVKIKLSPPCNKFEDLE